MARKHSTDTLFDLRSCTCQIETDTSKAYALRHADRLSGCQVLAVLEEYDAHLVEDGQPMTRRRLEDQGLLAAFSQTEFQFQSDPPRFLSTSSQLTIVLSNPICVWHRTWGSMLLVGEEVGLHQGLDMGQRPIARLKRQIQCDPIRTATIR